MGEENIIYKIEILQLIESKYNIEIKDEEVENIITFEDLTKLIKLKLCLQITTNTNNTSMKNGNKGV